VSVDRPRGRRIHALELAVLQPVRHQTDGGLAARLVNNLLQAKSWGAGDETLRFLANITLGRAGLFDPARSWWGIQPSDEDMGQTFATWGWRDSAFLSLPLFGPSTVRGGLGTLGDMPLDPTFYSAPVHLFRQDRVLCLEWVGLVGIFNRARTRHHLETKLEIDQG
jgi:ABC-type transporter lipoprotein component MlaA